MRVLAYLARYAPGAPTPWLLSLTRGQLQAFHDAVGEIRDMEQAKTE